MDFSNSDLPICHQRKKKHVGAADDSLSFQPWRSTMTTTTTTTESLHYHHGVICDECGMDSIVGTRYRSTRIIDYDICESCYKWNHEHWTMADAFVKREKNTTSPTLREIVSFDNFESRRVDSYGWKGLATQLIWDQDKVLENLDWTVPANHSPPSETTRQRVTQTIATSESLKVLYLQLHQSGAACPDSQQALGEFLIEGVGTNKSIQNLSVTLNVGSAPICIIKALATIIRSHSTIRILSIRNKSLQQDEEEDKEEQENVQNFSLQLFQALSQSKNLECFVCKDFPPLRHSCRAAAIVALQNCSSLYRIKANFIPIDRNIDQDELDVDNHDNELQQLQRRKHQRWMRNWTDVNATAQDRYRILQDIRQRVNSHPDDQVAAVFHFLRNNPLSLLAVKPK